MASTSLSVRSLQWFCEAFQTRMPTAEGLCTDPATVQAITEMPHPRM